MNIVIIVPCKCRKYSCVALDYNKVKSREYLPMNIFCTYCGNLMQVTRDTRIGVMMDSTTEKPVITPKPEEGVDAEKRYIN